jgi:hypothetical protein
VVNFVPQTLHLQGKGPQYIPDRRLGGSQSWSGHDGKEKNFQPLPRIGPYNPDHPAHSLVNILSFFMD